MTAASITANRDEIVNDIAAALTASHLAWENGETTSPDAKDFVIYARRILAEYPDFIGTTPEGEEWVAELLWEDQGERYVTMLDIANFLFDNLTAE